MTDNGAELILLVEDDVKIARLVRDYLLQEGYRVEHLDRGDGVEHWVQQHQPQLVVLDIMLPGRNGLDVCRALRAHGSLGIILLTARVDEVDRLLGLELGADDYVCKPFSPRELVARVRAVLRRLHAAPPSALPPASGPLQLDEQRWCARLHGQDLGLTAIEFQLLKVLVAQPGRIFSRDQLMDAMYRDERVVADRTVDSHIKKIRRKMNDIDPAHELIHSVYGVGYKYEP